MSVYWGLAGAAYRWLAPTGARRLLVFAGVFAAAEWLRGHLFTGFPWDLPGETWPAGSAPSQAAALVGAYGLSWITLAIAAAPGLGLRTNTERVAVAAALTGLLGLWGYGALRLAGAPAANSTGALVVRIVQPDTPELANYDAAAFADALNRNLALTKASAAKPPDVVIWSEEGLPAALDDYLAPGTWTLAAIDAALRPGETLITGGYRSAPARRGDYAPEGVAYFNSLIVLRRTAAGAEISADYDKNRLVPFGEYLPFERELAPLGFRKLTHQASGFAAGPPTQVLAPPGLPPLLPLICYESIFPGQSLRAQQLGNPKARWIVNISDDAWFGATMGPLQHLNIASYRAIEEGLPMARGTPTGVSAMIDAYGRILPGKMLKHGAFGAIDSPLPPPAGATPFSRWGETGFVLMLLGSLAALVRRRATLRRNDFDQ